MTSAPSTAEAASRSALPGGAGRGPGPLTLALAPRLAAGLIRTIWLTSRVTWIRRDLLLAAAGAERPFIMAFWHSRLLLMQYAHVGRPLAALISQHADGELIARTMARFGHSAVRGSSTRGGSAALRDALRFARAGGDLAITPDGPKGPVRIAKPGAVELARMAGLDLLPISLATRPHVGLRSWDRFEVPLPFGRVVIAFGEPLSVPREADEAARAALSTVLGARLDELTNECRAELGQAAWPAAGK